jgi:hypothetical protein
LNKKSGSEGCLRRSAFLGVLSGKWDFNTENAEGRRAPQRELITTKVAEFSMSSGSAAFSFRKRRIRDKHL